MNATNSYKPLLYSFVFLLTGFAGLTGYYILTCNTEIDFAINWNLFDSILAWPLFIVGFIVGLGEKFQVYEPWIKKTDMFGNVKYERDYDLIENVSTGCLMPLLQYFVIFPILFAAMIYYSLMGSIYLFGKIFPFLIVVFELMTIVLFFQWEDKWKDSVRIGMMLTGMIFFLHWSSGRFICSGFLQRRHPCRW